MKQLNRWQSTVYMLGGLLMVVGAGLTIFLDGVAPYVFGAGALAYTAMQFLQSYDGQSITIRRLRRILLLSDFLLLATALLMFASQGNIFGLSQIVFVQYIYKKWIGTLLLAAILQVYAVHRIDSELAKEANQ